MPGGRTGKQRLMHRQLSSPHVTSFLCAAESEHATMFAMLPAEGHVSSFSRSRDRQAERARADAEDDRRQKADLVEGRQLMTDIAAIRATFGRFLIPRMSL